VPLKASRASSAWAGRTSLRQTSLPVGSPTSPYLDEEQLFVNRDGIGFLLEIMPQSGADDRMVEVLISLYANCPAATGIQFHLFASPHIRPQLRRYANLRMEDADQLSKAQRWAGPPATTTCSGSWPAGVSTT
jgi:hypothetical protein